jgi:4-hydroxythreonine-4-phosphate dehydrogenase
MRLPRLGITLGDPGGIGPEVIAKAFSHPDLLPRGQYILFGTRRVIEQEEKALGIRLDIKALDTLERKNSAGLFLREIKALEKNTPKGRPSAAGGRASFLFFQEALREARKGYLPALITAPISKHAWHLAGIKWRGHTECLEHFYPGAIMSFWSEKMTVVLFSHHVPLKTALKNVKRAGLLRFFQRLHQIMERFAPAKSEFLVAGLNPHAGEDKLLGREEAEEIRPAIMQARKKGMRIAGPFPPDVVFREALGHPEKIVIALYHDQGLIAFKLESFETGINVTLGLPFIRTSPDHGTAFDLAGKNKASPQSMIEAIRLAHKFSMRAQQQVQNR